MGLFGTVLLAGPPALVAQEQPVEYKESNGFIDWYRVPSASLALKDSTGSLTATPEQLDSEGGGGYGARVRVPIGNAFFQGEFQNNTYDGFKGRPATATEADLIRFGIGYKPAAWPLYASLEHISQSVEVGIIEEFKDSGYGAHVGIQGGARARYHAEIGYVDVGELGAGVEYTVGGSYGLNRAFSLFVDHRTGTQKDGAGGLYEFSDTRLGIRIHFVSGPRKAGAGRRLLAD
jgi:hypothetical protein